ncbi:MAG: FecR family protein [Opitutaceae bacterium]
MPGTGGSYVYLREGFGRQKWGQLMAFLFIWQFLTLLLALGFVWRGQPAPSSATAVLLLPGRQLLPDGSVVELKDGAQIAVDFSGAFRCVALRRGEAHFQVTENKDRAFVVAANGVEVRAVGTAFSVQLGESAVAVLVTEGRVSVDKPPGNPTTSALASTPVPESPAFVDAGNRLVLELALEAKTPPVVNPVPAEEMAARLAWRVPRLEFSGTPLFEAVAMLNQHNRVQFLIADSAIAQEQVSGLFRADKADAFVQVLETGFRIKAERRGDSVIVLRRAP